MKKFGTLVIAAVFGTALLTGCTKKEETTTTTETSTTEAPAVVEETSTTMTTETTSMATETPNRMRLPRAFASAFPMTKLFSRATCPNSTLPACRL